MLFVFKIAQTVEVTFWQQPLTASLQQTQFSASRISLERAAIVSIVSATLLKTWALDSTVKWLSHVVYVSLKSKYQAFLCEKISRKIIELCKNSIFLPTPSICESVQSNLDALPSCRVLFWVRYQGESTWVARLRSTWINILHGFSTLIGAIQFTCGKIDQAI